MELNSIPFHLYKKLYTQVNKKYIISLEKGLFKYQLESRNFTLNNKFLNHGKSFKFVGRIHALRRSFGFNDIEASSYNGVKTYLKYPTHLFKYIFNRKKRLPLIEVGIRKRAYKNLFIKSANMLYHSIHNMPFRNVILNVRKGQFEVKNYILCVKPLNKFWIFSLLRSKSHLSLKTPLFVIKKRRHHTRPILIFLGLKLFLKSKNLIGLPALINRSIFKTIAKTIKKRKVKKRQRRRNRWTPIIRNLLMDFKERHKTWLPFLKNSQFNHELRYILPNTERHNHIKGYGIYNAYIDHGEFYQKIRLRRPKYKIRKKARRRLYSYVRYFTQQKVKRFPWRHRKHKFKLRRKKLDFYNSRDIKRLTPRFKNSSLKHSLTLLKWSQIPLRGTDYQDVLNLDARPHETHKKDIPNTHILARRHYFRPYPTRAPFTTIFAFPPMMKWFYQGRFRFIQKFSNRQRFYVRYRYSPIRCLIGKGHKRNFIFMERKRRRKFKFRVKDLALYPEITPARKARHKHQRFKAKYVARKYPIYVSSKKVKRLSLSIIRQNRKESRKIKKYKKKIHRYNNFNSLIRI
jgi:hypothetical protein